MVKQIIAFFLALIAESSLFSILLLFGAYAPVGAILTASSMPYLPPLSIIILGPPPDSNYCGWGVFLADVSVFGVSLKAPLTHYYCGGYQLIYNSKARLGETPWDTLKYQLEALIPPYTPVAFKSPPPSYTVLFVIPGWVYVPLLVYGLSYKLYFKARRAW